MKKIRGITLVEILITILIMSILATIAGPSFVESFEKRRLVSATQDIYSHIQLARSESITRSKEIFLGINASSTTDWSVGLSEFAACDPSITSNVNASACVLKIDNGDGADVSADDLVLTAVTSDDHEDIKLTRMGGWSSLSSASFDPMRGTIKGSGSHLHFVLTSTQGRVVHIRTSLVGNIDICSNDLTEYRSCS